MQKRRHERPIPRINPGGAKVWVARWTNRHGDRRSAGTFPLKGPCRDVQPEGLCCAQHRIDYMYEQDTAAPRRPDTVGAYAETWTTRRPRSARTNATNDHRLSRVLDVALEGRRLRDWPMHDLRRRHANELVDHMLRVQGRAVTGAVGILRTLSAMTEDAIEDEIVDINVWKVRVRASDPRATKQSRKPRVVSWEEMYRLAASAGSPAPPEPPEEPTETDKWRRVYGEVMVRVVADCGLRLGEVLALHRADLKLGEACDELDCAFAHVHGPRGPHLHVRRSAHNGVVTKLTKREKMRAKDEGGRLVPVPPVLAGMLRAMPPRLGTDMLFTTPRGAPWWEDNFRTRVWEPAREASGVDASPHDLRHSWISHLRAARVDPADLAQMAGHSVKTATVIYTHALGRSYEAAAAAVPTTGGS